jgi:hypothetical protein
MTLYSVVLLSPRSASRPAKQLPSLFTEQVHLVCFHTSGTTHFMPSAAVIPCVAKTEYIQVEMMDWVWRKAVCSIVAIRDILVHGLW